MKQYKYLYSALIIASVGSLVIGEDGCPTDLPYTSEMAHFHGTCYQFVSQEKFWHESRDYCLRNGGRLVKIDDPQTNEFIAGKLNALWWRNSGVWIGLHDIASEMVWQWTGAELHRNEPVRWTNWGRGHPGAFLHSRRDCVRMVRNDGWRWHETMCNTLRWHYRFICEYNVSSSIRQNAANGRRPRGQSSLNVQSSIVSDNLVETPYSENTYRNSRPQAAAAVQSDEDLALNEEDSSKSTIIAVAAACIVVATLAVVAFFMIYRRRRRINATRDADSTDNYVGSKVSKMDDALPEASSFRPKATANIYVDADTKGRTTSRLAQDPTEVVISEYGSSDEDEIDADRSPREEDSMDSAEEIDTSTSSSREQQTVGGYDAPKALNIYSEIAEDDNEEFLDNCHIYEALEDVRE